MPSNLAQQPFPGCQQSPWVGASWAGGLGEGAPGKMLLGPLCTSFLSYAVSVPGVGGEGRVSNILGLGHPE